MDATDVVEQAREAGLRLVRFLWCGNDGTIRAKASALGGLEGRISSGIGLTVAMQAMNGLDQPQPVEGMGPVGEVRLVPDPETFRVLPYAPRTGAVLCDLVQLTGEPAPQCPRSFLKRMAGRLEEHAGVLEVAFENEFSLARVVDGAYGRTVNVSTSGTSRTSPTGPIPGTGCSWSSPFIACIATVRPMPLEMRPSRLPMALAFARTVPSFPHQRKRTRRRSASRASFTTSVGLTRRA